jgi:hypothetical protein
VNVKRDMMLLKNRKGPLTVAGLVRDLDREFGRRQRKPAAWPIKSVKSPRPEET